MRNFIHKLRAQPEHIRGRIAYGTASLVTAVVAGIWVSASLMTTGILAPANSSYAYLVKNTAAHTAIAQSVPATSFLGSAVSAITGNAPAKPARLVIMNVSQSSTLPASSATTTDRTVIHF